MKKFIAILLCAGLFAGCGGSGGTGGPGGVQTMSGSTATVSHDINPTGAGLSGEITVSSFNAMPHKHFLETAAAMFEDKHPGVKVNVDIFSALPEIKTMESPDGQTSRAMMIDDGENDLRRPDYISKITTEMMSGGGPDLLAVDVLPYYKYALGGQLENLSGYMDADRRFIESDYRKNVLDAMRINGSLYVMPLDYRFSIAAYDPAMFSQPAQDALGGKDRITYEEMAAIADLGFIGEDARVLPMLGAEGMATAMLNADYGKYVDVPNKKAVFDNGDFAAMLEKAKEYEDKEYVLPGSIIQQARSGNMTMMPGSVQGAAFKIVNNQLIMSYMTNYYNPNRGAGMRQRLAMNGSTLEETDELIGPVTNSNGDIPFEFSQAYAINSNSKNKTLAWEFLKFLASEEVQTGGASAIGGIPINNKAAYSKAKLEAAGLGQRFMPGGMTAGPGGTGQGASQGRQGTDGGEPGEGRPQMRIEGAQAETEGRPRVRVDGAQTETVDRPQMRVDGAQAETEDQPQVRVDGAQTETEGRPQTSTTSGSPPVMSTAADPIPIDLDSIVLSAEQEKVLEEYLKVIEKYSNMLNMFYIKDPTVASIIDAEVKSYFSGGKSAEEAARIIQNRAGLYLSE